MTNTLYKELQKVSSGRLWVKKLFLSPKEFSFKYLRYRVLRPLLKGYYKLFNLFHPQSPWTTPASIVFFDKVLTKNMTGLEYGSGRSTIFFARRLGQLVSIEHHPQWYEKVKKLLQQQKLSNVTYLLIPEQGNNPGPDNQKLEARLNKMDGSEERPEFAEYYNKVNEFADGHFDFVLIDGRARVKCGLNAMNKLKSGGIFVLDNSERPRYQPLHRALESWPKTETTTGLTNTTIWIKP